MSAPTTAVYLTDEERETLWHALLIATDEGAMGQEDTGPIAEKLIPELPYKGPRR